MLQNQITKPKGKIVIFLGKITQKHLAGVEDLKKYLKKNFQIILIKSKGETLSPEIENKIFKIISVNLKRTDLIEKALAPYKNDIVAIVSKYENTMPLYARLTSLFPYLRNPLPRSIQTANDKVEMRKAMKKYAPKIAPRFTIVKDCSRRSLAKIEKYVKFPCIIKPANLSRSQLIINCYYRKELAQTLCIIFKKIKAVYRKNHVETEPKLLVESLMEGNLYSVDVHINSLGKLYFTPFVEIKTGKDIGHDDFFMYSQIVPSNLIGEEAVQARATVAECIYAVGLRSCTAHVEFYKTKNGFKIVEIASRTGGFRDDLLSDSYGLRHHMNDILIRLGKKPNLKPTKKKYTAFLKFWPTKQGRLVSIKGFKKCSDWPFVLRSKQQKRTGEKVGFSKFGHNYICSFNIIAGSRTELIGNIRKIEKTLSFEIE